MLCHAHAAHELARSAGLPVSRYQTKEILGQLAARRPTGVLAICDVNLARALTDAVDQYAALS